MRRLTHVFRSGELTPQDADALNLIVAELNRTKFSVSAPLALQDDAGGVRIGWQAPNQIRDVTSDGFWARITGAPGDPNGDSYPWIEQYQDADGLMSDMNGGRRGTIATTGQSEVQVLSISGNPNSGTFGPLTFNGQSTAQAITFNSSAAAVQSQLQALPNIGPGNVTCSGGPLPGSKITIVFGGALANSPQNLIGTGANNLTGGTNSAPSIARQTAGKAATTSVLPAVPADGSPSIAIGTLVFLWLSQNKRCYNFQPGGGGGGGGSTLTDEYDDGTSVFSPVTTQFWSKKDFVLTGVTVYSLSITGNPTGGNFQLSGVTVPWNQSAAGLGAALNAAFPNQFLFLTGGPLPGTAITIAGPLGLALGGNNLTGGTNPNPVLTAASPQPRFRTLGLIRTNQRVVNVSCQNGLLATMTGLDTFQDGLLQAVSGNFYTISLNGNPTGGNFVLNTDGGAITVEWNATAPGLQNQLGTTVPNENWLIGGGPLPGQVQLIGQGVLNLGANNLAGGTSPAPNLTGPD